MDDRLKVLPQGYYGVTSRHGNLIFTAGITPRKNGVMVATGIFCTEADIEKFRVAVEQAACNVVEVVKDELSDGEYISEFVNTTIYVVSVSSFHKQTAVADVASGWFSRECPAARLGPRTAVGVPSLPSGAPVEIAVVVGINR